ncbi:MAG: DUF1127 domain-containing protein [Paracoccaceae bacterium]
MNIVVLNTPAIPVRNARKAGFWARVWTAFTVYAERRDLADMSDHMLEDIGLSREDASIESRRPIWDLPTHR